MGENYSSSDKPGENTPVEQFLRLIMANQSRIYAFIVTMQPNLTDADDIMQETITVMWRKFASFKPGTNFVSWGIRIAHYEILEFRKKASKRQTHFRDEVNQAILEQAKIVHEKEDNKYLEALRFCLGKLGERERWMIQMRYDQNATHKIVADRIGLSVRSVCKMMAKIHDMLLRCVRRTLLAEEMA